MILAAPDEHRRRPSTITWTTSTRPSTTRTPPSSTSPCASRSRSARCCASRTSTTRSTSRAEHALPGVDAQSRPRAASPRPSPSSRSRLAPATVTVIAFETDRRGRARPLRPRPARRPKILEDGPAPAEPRRPVHRGPGRRRLRLALAAARRHPRSGASSIAAAPPRPPRPGAARVARRPARRRARRPRGPRRRPLRRIRDEDRRRHHPRLPRARVQGRATRSSSPPTSWRRSPATSARRREPRALGARRQALGCRSRRAPAAPPARWPASCSTSTPSARRAAATPSRPTANGSSELERSFPYRETADQIEAIEAVKADMESERPMDRLICGDVGYGKTEVAIRAAQKALADGKQVMMLVPTTILAQQHLGTFRERLRRPPATRSRWSRGCASRPRSKAALAAFADGSLDILIGTHRAALARRPGQGPRPARRRRGAALRRQAEGAAAPAQAEGRRALDVGDADPADAADEPRRPARHLGDRDAARGPAPGPHLRRPLRRGARPGRDPARGATATARSSSSTTGSTRCTTPPSACAPSCPRRAFAGGARPDGSRRAGDDDALLHARRGRRPRRDDDHRVRHRRPRRQHADRRARRHPRPRSGLPDPRPGRPLSRARLRLHALSLRGGL